ncbi:MAG: serine protease, partial [Dehalococcoidia bacterium]
MASLIDQVNGAISRAVSRSSAALVRVSSGRRGDGAGVVWDADGLIVTNAHVAYRDQPRVQLPDGRWVTGTVVARDRELDLAALRVEAGGLTAATRGDSRSLRPGELVFAQGHPWGVAGAISSGVVIGVGPDWPGLIAGNEERAGDAPREWLVVNMRLRPGNSGGPVMDSEGRLVGIS